MSEVTAYEREVNRSGLADSASWDAGVGERRVGGQGELPQALLTLVELPILIGPGRRASTAIAGRLPAILGESIPTKQRTRVILREFGNLGRRHGVKKCVAYVRVLSR